MDLLRMSARSQDHRLVPWAWSLAWFLTSLGFGLSLVKVSSTPNLFAYIALGALGWSLAGLFTARATRGKPGLVFRLVGWGIASLAFILLSVLWMRIWDAGFLAFIVAPGVAAVIGGIPGSSRKGPWRWLSGILLGVLFVVLAALNFFATYILWLGAYQISQPGVHFVATGLAWVMPSTVLGLAGGFALRGILGLRPAAVAAAATSGTVKLLSPAMEPDTHTNAGQQSRAADGISDANGGSKAP